MSRRGLIIRLLIFLPLFAYFGFGAVQKCRNEQQAAEDAARQDSDLKSNTKTVPLGNGKTIEVIEMTPEQAAKLGYKPPEIGPADPPARTPEVKSAPDEAKAADVKAGDATADVKSADAKGAHAESAEAKAN